MERRQRFVEAIRDALREGNVSIEDKTPERLASWLWPSVNRSSQTAQEVLGESFYANGYDELVMVKDIEFSAICEHHLLPFIGKAAVGYVPSRQLVGLSKLSRLVTWASSSATLQEGITVVCADELEKHIRAKGVMVVLYNVVHSCMATRGIRDRHAVTTTSAVRGIFKDSQAARNEFLQLLNI